MYIYIEEITTKDDDDDENKSMFVIYELSQICI